MAATPPRAYDWESVLAYSSAAMSLTEQDVEELRSERSIKSTKVCYVENTFSRLSRFMALCLFGCYVGVKFGIMGVHAARSKCRCSHDTCQFASLSSLSLTRN